MKRIWAALAALLFFLPAFAEGAPRVRHGVAAQAPACRAGSVRLNSGLCCPRSGVTRGGGCVSGAVRPDIVPPPIAYCYGGGVRDALGRCPTTACAAGYVLGRSGQCRREVTCANGLTPTALGQCPPDIETRRVELPRTCPGGGFADINGNCLPLSLCSNGFAAIAGRCPHGGSLIGRAHSSAPVAPAATAPLAPGRAHIARPTLAIPSLARPQIATPHIHTPSALGRAQIARPLTPQIQTAPALARPQIARPITPHIQTPALARPQVVTPHLAPAQIVRPSAPPAVVVPRASSPALAGPRL